MKISRRNFFKSVSTAAVGGLISSGVACSKTGVEPLLADKRKGAKQTTSICPFCAVGCGMIVSEKDGKIINIEGDPDHPINEGSLCAKGNALFQIANNEKRLDKVLYRAPGSIKWEEKTWEWTLAKIALNVKKTRDTTFLEKKGQNVVNRTEGIASLGGAALDNEECYLISKLMRSLGITYLEHQARI